MTLILQGVALDEQPISQPLTGRFDERGGTLGRSETVTFTLPDPERMISRIHAQVLFRDDGYWVENLSAANPILHNGRPLSSGMRVMLREGDELRVGGYTLRVAFEQDEASATILRGRTVITHRPDAGSVPTSAQTVVSGDNLRQNVFRGSGVTRALEAALDRFDPVKLEATLGKQSMFETLRPGRYKARLWELYLERFRSLRQAAQEDLQRLFSNGAGIE